jgi:hypothetical protein
LADEDPRAAVIIGPVFEQFHRDRSLIAEPELELIYTLDTQVHADHLTASGLLRAACGARSVISERSGAVCADLQVKHGDVLRFGRHTLPVRETPGHTVCPADEGDKGEEHAQQHPDRCAPPIQIWKRLIGVHRSLPSHLRHRLRFAA